jgi:hypothetical protein
MIQVCPNPAPWARVYERLSKFAESHKCSPTDPPKPLILNGWVFSGDLEKKMQWEATVKWAEENGCADLTSCANFGFGTQDCCMMIGDNISHQEQPLKHLGCPSSIVSLPCLFA